MVNKLIKNKKGFTLMEIIVVLVIMGILLAIAVPAIMGYVKKANDAKFLSVARVVNVETQAYMEEYMLKNPTTKTGTEFNEKTIVHFKSLFAGSLADPSKLKPIKAITDGLIDVSFPDDYTIVSVDVEFDNMVPKMANKRPLNGWQYDDTKLTHTVTKVSIFIMNKNTSDVRCIVTMFNNQMYMFSSMQEIYESLDKLEPQAPILALS
ncbi:type IV pilin protein [Amedibacillus sp. YH-ame10]